jgi:porin
LGAPQEDRNLIDFSLNAGFAFHEPILFRDDDTFAIGMGFAKVGDHAADWDRDVVTYTGTFHPIRSDETYVEVTYQIQVTPWWQIQPDFQYVLNPGAGLANPHTPGLRIQDEAVIGVRTNILF